MCHNWGYHRLGNFIRKQLKDEEEHVDFLEAQLHQVEQTGYERYLSQQIGGSEEK
jgi:bacterioferritin (cytochrome b1)